MATASGTAGLAFPARVRPDRPAFREPCVLRPIALARALDGTQLPEQREWRINATARYDFLDGPFKGFQVGGSLRYQDKVAGGYPNLLDETAMSFPTSPNPWFGPDDINGDMFFRYRRPIMNDRVDWSMQLQCPQPVSQEWRRRYSNRIQSGRIGHLHSRTGRAAVLPDQHLQLLIEL